MTQTFPAVLRGGHIEWVGEPPTGLPDGTPVRVEVVVPPPVAPAPDDTERGRRMAALFQQIADRGTAFAEGHGPGGLAAGNPPRPPLAREGVMLLDSNILIYASKPAEQWARTFTATHNPAVSAISLVEVLGYHNLQPQEEQFLRGAIGAALVLPITDDVIWRAVALRQQRRIDLGDALIAATALIHGLPLATRNMADFAGISGLTVIDPLVP